MERDDLGNDMTSSLWKQYKVDPLSKETSNFRGMETLKLLKDRIDRQIILGRLKNEDLIVDHFALHNEWELDRKALEVNLMSGAQSSNVHTTPEATNKSATSLTFLMPSNSTDKDLNVQKGTPERV